jgi:hypothetical protein
MKTTLIIGMSFIAGLLAQPPSPISQRATITWSLVEEPKLTTYRVYHLTHAPPTDRWAIPTNAAVFDIGITNRFVHNYLDRSKTNYWAVTFLVDTTRIVGGGLYGKILESDISNWVGLLPGVESPDSLQIVIQ